MEPSCPCSIGVMNNAIPVNIVRSETAVCVTVKEVVDCPAVAGYAHNFVAFCILGTPCSAGTLSTGVYMEMWAWCMKGTA